jgi:hypothetical protein
VITMPPRHHEHQTQVRPATSCSPSTPDHYPQVLNLNASEHSPSLQIYCAIVVFFIPGK